jgi:hypothetical protein
MLASHAARGEQIVQAPPGGEDVATDRSWLEGGLLPFGLAIMAMLPFIAARAITRRAS